ncbi:hypothetical protein SAMN05421840_11910 [Shewanella morhuae]|nr:hypothetical protein SAMN05421840_11910 [Shewanella morhuae]
MWLRPLGYSHIYQYLTLFISINIVYQTLNVDLLGYIYINFNRCYLIIE